MEARAGICWLLIVLQQKLKVRAAAQPEQGKEGSFRITSEMICKTSKD